MVQTLADRFSEYRSAIAVDYRGLSVVEITNLRRALKETNSIFFVSKNTLTKIAIQDTEWQDLTHFLTGPTAFAATSDSPVETVKILRAFIKEYPKITLKGGVVEGQTLDLDGLEALAKVLPREMLLAKLFGSMNAPISGFVRVLNGPLQGFMTVLNAIKDRKENDNTSNG